MTNVSIEDMQECIDLVNKRDRAIQAQVDKTVNLLKSAIDMGYNNGDYRTASRFFTDAGMEVESLRRLMDNLQLRLGVLK